MAECELSCAKYWVFFFNLLFALTGLAILIDGAFTQYAFTHYENFIGDTYYSAPVIMMIIGGIIFVVAFFGCCGAIQESSCMMLSFTVCLLVIILFEIGIGAAGFMKHKELGGILDKGFNQTLTHYADNKAAWKVMQEEFKCCGINGPDDWQTVFHNSTLPNECCRSVANLALNETCIRTDKGVIEDGCKTKFLDFLASKATTFGAIGIAVALIQIIGLTYACYLYRAFRRNYESV